MSINEKFDKLFEDIEEITFENGKNSAEIIGKIIEEQGKFIENMANVHNLIDKMLQMQVVSGEKLEDYGELARTLILKLNEKEIELTREAIEKAGGLVRIFKDTLISPEKDSEGNIIPGGAYKGELSWVAMTKAGIEISKLVPDALLGVSFQKVPVFYMDTDAALISFDEDESEPVYRFVNDRVGQGFPGNKQPVDKIRPISSLDTSLKFETKHESKMNEVKRIISQMEDLKGYKTLGLIIEESFKVVRKTNKADEAELILLTNVKGVFYCPSETKGDEEFTGTLEFAEWVIFEDQKSSKKVETRAIHSDSLLRGNKDELTHLVTVLKEMTKTDRDIFIANIKANEKTIEEK